MLRFLSTVSFLICPRAGPMCSGLSDLQVCQVHNVEAGAADLLHQDQTHGEGELLGYGYQQTEAVWGESTILLFLHL